jgi:hypothetical protein
MFTNCVVKLNRLDLNKTVSGLATDIRFDVPMGQVRVSLAGGADYAFVLDSMRLTVARNVAQDTVFVFAGRGALTVLKGAVTASIGLGQERLVRAGEQLRRDASEVTKLPPGAPELKLGQ